MIYPWGNLEKGNLFTIGAKSSHIMKESFLLISVFIKYILKKAFFYLTSILISCSSEKRSFDITYTILCATCL